MNTLLAILFVLLVAALFHMGIWANVVTLFNVITSSLLAMIFWEPFAGWLESSVPSFTFAWDFMALWLLFSIFSAALGAIAGKLSTVKVRFIRPVDMGGGAFFAAWTAWILVGFLTVTLHTAPLARNFMRGTFYNSPDERIMYGTMPDRVWLGFVQRMSRWTLARSEPNVFDPNGEFILKYGDRRSKFEEQEGLFVVSAESAQ